MSWKTRDFMSTSAETIDCHESLADAALRMQELNVHHLPVTDGDALVGVLSERDILRFETRKRVSPTVVQVGEAMTPEPFTVSPDTPVAEVALEMSSRGYGSALVVDHGSLIGLFTANDALRGLATVLGTQGRGG